MPQNHRTGPLEGHWTESLCLIEVVNEGEAFVCELCRDSGRLVLVQLLAHRAMHLTSMHT